MEDKQLVEVWESSDKSTFSILEAINEVDGEHILARVEGPAFFPNTTSGNRVYYSSEVWENAIKDDEFISRLNDRLVFGTIGHDPDLNDKEVREGKLSHLVSKVWIDEESGEGRAEYLVLNTAPGRVLNTLLRVGSKLRVSTRADGTFKKVRSPGIHSSKEVDPSTFKLDRIDFVCNPGYKEALPKLLESSSYDITKDNDIMDKVVEILEAQVEELKGDNAKLRTQIEESRTELAKTVAELDTFKNLGTTHSIVESVSELGQYRDIGTVQEIHEAMEKGETVIDDLADKVSELNTVVQELTDELNNLEKDNEEDSNYVDLGTPEEVKESLSRLSSLESKIKAYEELGSVEEINALLERVTDITEALEQQELQTLADKYQIDLATVTSLSEKFDTLEEAEALIASIKGTGGSETTSAVEEQGDWYNEDGTPNPEGSYDAEGVYYPERDDKDQANNPSTVHESLSTRLLQRSQRFSVKIKEGSASMKDQNRQRIHESNNSDSLASRLLLKQVSSTKKVVK